MKYPLVILIFFLSNFMNESSCRCADESTAYVEMVKPSEAEYWVGQRITFSIDLLAEGQFSGAAYFDLPKMSGVIIMKNDERPILLSKEKDDKTYVVQRHEFSLFVQYAGTCKLPSFNVRFGTKESFDKPVVEQHLTTKPLDYDIKMPEGAKTGELVISTTQLKAEEKWKPEIGEFKVGDALIRTVVIKASDIPGMLLPFLPSEKIDGVSIYPKEPNLKDHTNRGEFTGERDESITYVFNKSGEYKLPEVVIRWWNIKEKKWNENRFPAINIKVKSNPAFASQLPKEGSPELQKQGTTLSRVVLFIILIVVIVSFGFLLKIYRSNWKLSEAGLFSNLIAACKKNDVSQADRELVFWLDSMSLSRILFIDSISEYEQLMFEYQKFQEALIIQDQSWNGLLLSKSLQVYRRAKQNKLKKKYSESNLPELNPVSVKY